MTLDEAIKGMETVAEENQKVVDTHIVFDDVTIDMLYCDDTEVIEEHLANYQWCAEEHRQLAEWLKDYKRLLEQEPCEDAISRQYLIEKATNWEKHFHDSERYVSLTDIQNAPSVKPQELKTGHWIEHFDESGKWYECDQCHTDWGGSVNFCPNCGAKMKSEG